MYNALPTIRVAEQVPQSREGNDLQREFVWTDDVSENINGNNRYPELFHPHRSDYDHAYDQVCANGPSSLSVEYRQGYYDDSRNNAGCCFSDGTQTQLFAPSHDFAHPIVPDVALISLEDLVRSERQRRGNQAFREQESGEGYLEVALRNFSALVRASLGHARSSLVQLEGPYFMVDTPPVLLYYANRVQEVVQIYFNTSCLDVLQGFDNFLPPGLMSTCLSFLGIVKPDHGAEVDGPNPSQLAIAMIVLDFIDVSNAQTENYSAVFLCAALEYLEYASHTSEIRADPDFLYAVLLLGLRNIYHPSKPAIFRCMLPIASQLLKAQRAFFSEPYDEEFCFSAQQFGEMHLFFHDAMMIVAATFGATDRPHGKNVPAMHYGGEAHLRSLSAIPNVAHDPRTRIALLFAIRARQAFLHLRYWCTEGGHYRKIQEKDFQRQLGEVQKVANRHLPKLWPQCLHEGRDCVVKIVSDRQVIVYG
ncbi:hypothetical protein SISNIDRAFT_279250 [Sistotremastrum niveocremeum HHB9708]|uniref:Uncharacterized protein n=1 Tax=Sistotremastrum niveocremeum HHB9708 TaxID=1314777 RepID=A0A164NQK7_9AGAM|nr:hypothetical protein SISNIDRAFT_279250 [Sistotremastrum niveocremeum HHB9708]